MQKDDMEKVYPALLECDALALASPIYYFTMTAQIQAAIQRIYAIDHPPKATKAALMLSSMSPEVYEGSIGEYEGIIDYMGLEDRGIITADDSENGTEALMENVVRSEKPCNPAEGYCLQMKKRRPAPAFRFCCIM